MAEIDTGSARIHYEVVGTGDPVLLMHGGTTSSEYWKRAGYVDILAARHTVVTFDFRGHGFSARPHDETMYGLRHDVSDALAVLDAAGVDSATVFGWSWGGTVALALAALHPERVSSVLALGASGRHGQFSDLPSDFSRFHEKVARIEQEGLAGLAEDVERMGGKPWLGDVVRANDPAALAAWYRGQSATPPIGSALSDIEQPIIFVAGEHELPLLGLPDPLLPSHAQLRVIPGANHVSAFLDLGQTIPALTSLSADSHIHRHVAALRRQPNWHGADGGTCRGTWSRTPSDQGL
jgi:pimeloyl-ACP methyl ester carboxylesterase